MYEGWNIAHRMTDDNFTIPSGSVSECLVRVSVSEQGTKLCFDTLDISFGMISSPVCQIRGVDVYKKFSMLYMHWHSSVKNVEHTPNLQHVHGLCRI